MLGKMWGIRLAVICSVFLIIAGCSKKNTPVLDADAGSATPGSGAEVPTVVGARIYFIVDRSDLTPEAKDTLMKQAEWLKRYGNVTVQIEGHADERGTREY